jgi:outer membrane lipoprotein SlyB
MRLMQVLCLEVSADTGSFPHHAEVKMNKCVAIAGPIFFAGIFALSGCATQYGPGTVSSSSVGRQQSVQYGTVEGVRGVTIQNDRRDIGTATGAILGGIAGSALGNGNRANTAGAVAGAVAGGAVGNAVSATTRPGIEITVQLDGGRTIAVVQDGNMDQFRVGDRVQITSDGVTTRVTR